MAIINKSDKNYIKEKFEREMEKDVKVVYFTQDFECQFCKETREILEELKELSNKIKLEIHEFNKEKEIAEKYKVDKIPAILLFGEKEYGVRFFGIPSGYEFSALIEDIISVSRGRSNLKEETKEEIRKINKKLHLQVFVTPTCPYCPSMTHLAHQMAIENENITADMIEIVEFPHLAHKYNVMGVPKTVINDKIEIVGSVREEHLLNEIRKAI